MKKTALRYGAFSAISIIALFMVGFAINGLCGENYELQEIFGYANMVISMVFVFFGIKHFRDHINGGTLTFGKGMKVGLLIVLIPSIAFGLFDILYVTAIDPGCMDRYYQHQLSDMKVSMTPTEFSIAKTRMESQKELFDNLPFQFIVMALTVFLIGVIATVISSLILKRPKKSVGQ